MQTVNGLPTFFVSPNNYINSTVKGKFKVETSSDDDYIGFVFGYQSPLTINGDLENDFEFLLFDWKQNTQIYQGATAQEGFSLVRVKGILTNLDGGPEFWEHIDSAKFQVLATNYATSTGWLDNTEYDFELLYTSGRIKISINNQTIFDVLGSFPTGRFGFYNYSQSQVRYSQFTFTTNVFLPIILK